MQKSKKVRLPETVSELTVIPACVSRPSSSGKAPLKRLLEMFREVIAERLPSSSGTLPLMA